MILKDFKNKKLAEYINEYTKQWDFYGVIQIIKSEKLYFKTVMVMQV